MAVDKRLQLFWRQIFSSFTRRRTRALIAGLGVAIGATTLTTLGSIYLDLDLQLNRELRAYGANLVVTAQTGRLDDRSVNAAETQLGDVEVLGQANYRYENVVVRNQPLTFVAVDPALVLSVRPYWQIIGELPIGEEVVLGRDVAELLNLSIGDNIRVQAASATENDDDTPALVTPLEPGVPNPIEIPHQVGEVNEIAVKVSGILSTGGAEDGYLVGSFGSLVQLYQQPGALDLVEYSVVSVDGRLPQIAERMSVGGVNAKVVKRLASSDAQVQETLSSLLLLVSAVVLAITMITVATTMMAVVTERQTEIGLRKALGASDAAVRGEFLTEVALLGALGGLSGVWIGLGLAAWVCWQVFGRQLQFNWSIAPVVVLLSIGVTVFSGYLPVQRAATVQPAIVLRGE